LALYNEAEDEVANAGGNQVGALASLTEVLGPGVYFLWVEAAQVSGDGTNVETTDMHDRILTPYLLNLVFE